MKKVSVIVLTLLYMASASGLAVSKFYCCGKLKETYVSNLISSHGYPVDKPDAGCCDTKTAFLKIKDDHSAAQQFRTAVFSDFLFLNNSFTEPVYISSKPVFISCGYSPPPVNKYPIYLSVNNFRI